MKQLMLIASVSNWAGVAFVIGAIIVILLCLVLAEVLEERELQKNKPEWRKTNAERGVNYFD